MKRRAAACLLLALLLVQGCASRPARPLADDPLAAQALREQRLGDAAAWSFRGRVAVAVDGEGGSGRLQWRQQGGDFDIQLTVPVTGQAWRLVGAGGAYRLAGPAGGERSGADPQVLLEAATGWPLPLAAMSDWVRGLRHQGAADIEFDSSGLPRRLREQGWTVDFHAWDDQRPPRPVRIHARRGDTSVRLAIDAWEAP